MERPTKEELLSKYAKKPVRRLLQLDGFSMWMGVCGEPPEPTELFPDGYDVFAGETYELRSSGPDLAVRLHVAEGADRGQVLALLDKIRDWLTDDYDGTIESVAGTEPEPDYKARAGWLLEALDPTPEETMEILLASVIPMEDIEDENHRATLEQIAGWYDGQGPKPDVGAISWRRMCEMLKNRLEDRAPGLPEVRTEAYPHNRTGRAYCDVCGKAHNVDCASVRLVLTYDNEEKTIANDLCDDCIAAGPEAVAKVLEDRAKGARIWAEEQRGAADEANEHARDLEQIAGNPAGTWASLEDLKAAAGAAKDYMRIASPPPPEGWEDRCEIPF